MALKAPFPYFGGKSKVAGLVWERFGPVDNYIEPFFGSGAVFLRSPYPAPKYTTVNDHSHWIANFWRAMAADPEATVAHADWPVNECDLHARHQWLMFDPSARASLLRVRLEPDYFDAKIAGWWAWGQCCWIGSGWCQDHGRLVDGTGMKAQMPELGRVGRGLTQQVPELGGTGRGLTQRQISVQLNRQGVHRQLPAGRPQLGDAYARGRGVHGNDGAETCLDRRAWLTEWFYALSDVLRSVRVCCGDWSRICSSDTTTTRLGLTAIFLDPPYRLSLADGSKNRDGNLYMDDKRQDISTLVDDVQAYCLEYGVNPNIRIAVCGYEGEGYEKLEAADWSVVEWKANGGYANRGGQNDNAARERIWFSPACLDPEAARQPLFSGLVD